MPPVVGGRIGLELEAGQDHAEEQPAAMVAADEIGVLALPADPRRLGERLFHHRRGVDEHLQLRWRGIDDEPGERLQRLLDRLVIIAALGIGRDPSELGMLGKRKRIGRRRIAHSQGDRRPRLGPQRARADSMVRALLHPAHRPVMPGFEPATEIAPRRVRRIGAREAARSEADPFRFRPYCFLKALAFMHAAPVHGPPRFS